MATNPESGDKNTIPFLAYVWFITKIIYYFTFLVCNDIYMCWQEYLLFIYAARCGCALPFLLPYTHNEL